MSGFRALGSTKPKGPGLEGVGVQGLSDPYPDAQNPLLILKPGPGIGFP